MTVYNELNKIAYIGSSEQTLYPIPFEYISTDDIKVSIYTSNNEFVEDWTYSIQYVIEGGNVKVLSGYNIDNTKKLLILRSVDLIQDNKYREGGDFPAKSTETSFDKLTMITQQLQETLDRCVKVEVLDIQTPEELLQTVYDKLDSATEIAGDAISAANQAQTAADNATAAVNSAEQTLVQTQAYVDSAKVEIDNTKNTAINTINSTVAQAKADVNSAVDEATMNISDTSTAAINKINSVKDSATSEINSSVSSAETEITSTKNTAINTINSVKDSATSEINSSVSSAETEITSTKNTAINTINTAVSNAESNISTIVSDAEGSITNIAITEATKAIANAAQEATDTATANVNSYVDGTVKPSLQTYVDELKPDLQAYVDELKPDLQAYVDQAQGFASNSQISAEASATSAAAALVSANNASESATTASGYATNAQDSATSSSNYASNSQASANSASESAQNAAQSAQEAADSATSSSNYASNSQASANSASESAQNAAQSAQEAADSAALAIAKSSFGNIGDIKYTSRTDVPNGGAWCDGALYTKAQFPDIYQMLVDGKLQSTTISTFDSKVSANGSCGFFGLDTANERFKVPMLKDVYIKAGQAPSMFGAESLPNITGAYAHSTNAETRDIPASAVGAFFVNANETGMKNSSKTNDEGAVMRFSASRSSSTYKDGAKVNPDHVTYRAYVVLYASAAEASVAQAAEFMTALRGKANVDMNNLSAAGKQTVVGWGMPDYSAGVSYSSNFVAPTNGYCVATNYIGAWGVAKLLADGGVIDQQHNPTSGTKILIHTRGFCKKGQTISKDGVSDWGNIIFYPCIGG